MPKNVHFFRLDMEKQVATTLEFKPLKDLEEKQQKMNLVSNKIKENENHLVIAPEKRPQATLEIEKTEGTYIFGKLCKVQDVVNFQIREKDTLASNRLVIESNQVLEKFSYFLMDTSNFAVSYIKESSAPTIHYLADAITQEFGNSNPAVRGKMSALLAEDAIAVLAKKDIIGTIKYDMTIPASMGVEITGMNEKDYLDLQNVGSFKIQVQIKAHKRKKTTLKPENILGFLSNIGKGKDKVVINAKDADEDFIMPYVLDNNPYIKKVRFEDIEVDSIEEFDKEVFRKLKETYENNKRDVVEYLGF